MKNNSLMASQNNFDGARFNLRVVPWFTDGCSTFLTNLFKWFPRQLGGRMTVLEFGGGNSTFFFLSKGLKVVSVESDEAYVNFLCNVAKTTGFKVNVCAEIVDFDLQNDDADLHIIYARKFDQISRLIEKYNFDIVVNDGISRREVLEKIINDKTNSIVVLDNVEYSANWGRLDRSSAKPDLIKVYRTFLRSTEWQPYIFEQSEGRSGYGSADKTGWESPHRWISAVCWPRDHMLGKLMMTNLGFPVVNFLGKDDQDIQSLATRCPYDWNTNSWLKENFPPELDLTLERSFD